jgi:hypothetical protein
MIRIRFIALILLTVFYTVVFSQHSKNLKLHIDSENDLLQDHVKANKTTSLSYNYIYKITDDCNRKLWSATKDELPWFRPQYYIGEPVKFKDLINHVKKWALNPRIKKACEPD